MCREIIDLASTNLPVSSLRKVIIIISKRDISVKTDEDFDIHLHPDALTTKGFY